ncbi:MAG: fibrobacter succinogenes major paralogous domain-containing protein [Daejeonella sp.]
MKTNRLIYVVLFVLSSFIACKKDKKDTPSNTVKDFDGNVYKTVKIGDQVWMAENLNSTHYQDGTPILNKNAPEEWVKPTAGYCDPDPLKSEYGKMYNWYAATDAHNIAPKGWRVPTKDDFATLIQYLKINNASDQIVSNKVRETGTTHWSTDIGANNDTGFTAFPSPYRVDNGTFYLGDFAHYLSSTTDINNIVFGLIIAPDKVTLGSLLKGYGGAIRCIQEK